MSVCCQHNDGIGKGEEFISIIIVFFIDFIVSNCKLPNNSLNLLCFPREPELGEKLSNSLVVLDFFEFKKLAIGTKNFQNFGIILTKVIAQQKLIKAFYEDEIFGD